MEGFADIRLTQAKLALLANVDRSIIHRKIASANIQPADGKKKYGLNAIQEVLKPLIFRHGEKIVKRTHVFYNFKGGTGKSTLSSQVAYQLSLFGFKVLAIDLDPQAHLTLNLGFDLVNDDLDFNTMYDVMVEGENIKDAIYSLAPRLDLIPSSLRMTKIDVPLSQKARREEVLKKNLKRVESEYDFIIIDTNPTLSVLNMNALIASDQINVVCSTHPLAYHGLIQLVEDLIELFDDMENELCFKIIPNLHENKTATAQEVLGGIRQEYKEKVLQTVVHKVEDFNIASKYGLPIVSFAKKGSLALEDIIDLTNELIKLSVEVDVEKNRKVKKVSDAHAEARV